MTNNEYRTSNRYIAYPFTDDAAGLAHKGTANYTTPLAPLDLLLDASLQLDSGYATCYLGGITIPSANVYRLTLHVDAHDAVATVDYSDTGAELEDIGYIRLTVSSTRVNGELLADRGLVAYLRYLTGTLVFGRTLPFEARAACPVTGVVKTFELYTALPSSPEIDVPGPIVGDVGIMAGYNILANLQGNALTLAAVPGAGVGKAPCQDATAPAGNLFPDQLRGLTLLGDACINVVPQASTGIIQLQGTCRPCCSCADYTAVARALKTVIDRINGLCASLHTFYTTTLPAAVVQYNTVYIPSVLKLAVSVTGGYRMIGLVNKYQWLTLDIYLANLTPMVLSGSFAITLTTSAIRVIEQQLSGMSAGSAPLSFTFANLQPGTSAGLRVVIKNTMINSTVLDTAALAGAWTGTAIPTDWKGPTTGAIATSITSGLLT